MHLHKSQVLALILISFIVGVGIGSYVTMSSIVLLIGISIALILIGGSAYHRTFGSSAGGIRRRTIGFLTGCMVLIAFLGMYHVQRFDANQSRLVQFNDRTVSGEIVPVIIRGYVTGAVGDRQIILQVKEIISGRLRFFVDERALVRVLGGAEYRYGDVLLVRGTPTEPDTSSADGFGLYLRKQSIRSIIDDAEIRSGGESLDLGLIERSQVHREYIELWLTIFFKSSVGTF